MKSPAYTLIDCSQFNKWGLDIINKTLKGYLDNNIQSSSVGYFHVVLITFAIEALTELGNFNNIHYDWLVNGYSSTIVNHESQDYRARVAYLWDQYKHNVKQLVSSQMQLSNLKSYTSEFVDEDTIKIAEVNTSTIQSSVTQIF